MDKTIIEKTVITDRDFSLLSFPDGFPLYDQRYLPRWETGKKAYYHLKGAHVIYRTQIKNLNATGVCLYVARDVRVNQRLELKIYFSQEKSFEIEGTVIWTNTSDQDLSWAGIMFDNLPQEIRDRILEYAFEVS